MTHQREFVRACIRTLLEAHAANPFAILRETGIQAELRQILLCGLQTLGRHTVPVRFKYSGKRPRFTWGDHLSTLRVQLEVKPKGGGQADRKSRHLPECVDIVVLRPDDAVELVCYPGGPGDIVAAIDVKHIESAIEVKASPSSSKQQRTLYADDVTRLLRMAKSHGTDGFFVLIDKSTGLYGAGTKTSSGFPAIGDLSCGSRLHASPPAVDVACVDIWFLDRAGGGAGLLVRLLSSVAPRDAALCRRRPADGSQATTLMKSAGTRSTSQTPFSLRKNT